VSEDDIYKQPLATVPDFVFDDKVAAVFSDMISRSVPGYATITAVSGVLAERFSQPNTQLYDLGCSLGSTTLAMARSAASNCSCIAVDNSKAMIERLTSLLVSPSAEMAEQIACLKADVQPLLSDVMDVEISNASMVAMNFTLQFLSIDQRVDLINKIYQGLNTDGVFVLSEKIVVDNTLSNELFIDLHHSFKRNNGYSDIEISQKRDAIENVLIPETIQAHKQRLLTAGFTRVEIWFQCFNFVSLVAFK